MLLVGDSGVGKSSLVSRFTRGKFKPDPKPTSTNIIAARHVYVDGKVIKARIVDVAGYSSYSDISRELPSTNGALIVYDVTSHSTFTNAEKWYRELRIAHDQIEMMLIGNKSDLINDSVTTTAIAGKAFAQRESLGFIETSAKDYRNVEKAFVQVVTRIFQKLFKNDIRDAINALVPAISSEARMSRYSGKNEPAHFMLKIESFSLLCEARTNELESDVFEASGYKWRLELYPNGNAESGGNHISIYLAICDAESLPKGWQVWVDGKFCVYDHIHNNYITFQDGDGKRTRFHEKMIKWGFSKLISLDSFTDARNGLLIHDSCVFGAEIFAVPKYAGKDQCLSLIKPPTVVNTHTWTIENFSAITEKELYSDDFKIGKVNWRLNVHPKGNVAGTGTGTSLSIFLELHNSELLPDGWRAYAKYKLRVKNQGGDADRVKEVENWFHKSTAGWGYQSFMLLSEVGDPEKGFLLHDVLIVEAEISVVGILHKY